MRPGSGEADARIGGLAHGWSIVYQRNPTRVKTTLETAIGVSSRAWRGTHAQYLKFADHRLRPAVDLLNRLDLDHPGEIYDLGPAPAT